MLVWPEHQRCPEALEWFACQGHPVPVYSNEKEACCYQINLHRRYLEQTDKRD